jgi:hypothetical protein
MTTPSRTRTLALAGLVAPVWFTAMVAIQGELYPCYSLVISALVVVSREGIEPPTRRLGADIRRK